MDTPPLTFDFDSDNATLSDDGATTDPTNNPSRKRKVADDVTLDYNPLEVKEIEMADKVNDNLSSDKYDTEVGGAHVVSIEAHSLF